MNIVSGIDPGAIRRDIGRFRVSTHRERVAAFRSAIALSGGDDAGVPPTFPLTWWMEDVIKGALVGAMGGDPFRPDAALVHLDQTLDYQQPLAEDAEYWLDLVLIGPTSDERFRVEAQIVDDADQQIGFLAGGFARARLG